MTSEDWMMIGAVSPSDDLGRLPGLDRWFLDIRPNSKAH